MHFFLCYHSYGDNMRIISGKFKGRKINRVGIKTTRETADMVKEAVFQMIAIDQDSIVLDLFAGSGAYAFESISRGAKHAYVSDINHKAIHTIKSNAKTLDVLDKIDIYLRDYKKMITKVEKLKFSHIFIDPPYVFKHYDILMQQLIPLLKEDGLIILETEKRTPIQSYERLEIIKEKLYGIKRITIYKK